MSGRDGPARPASTPALTVLDKFFASAPHQHPDSAQRLQAIAQLAPEAKALAQLLATDPDAQVRAAAAARCADAQALEAALRAEREPAVREAIGAALGRQIATGADAVAVQRLLDAPDCPQALRAAVALHASDDERRRLALEAIADEEALVDVALAAAHAPQRLAAAERVRAPQALRRLYEGAKERDRGLARLARQRLDELAQRARDAAAADELLAQAAALVEQPGAVVMAAVELDRRWRKLRLGEDPQRQARWEEIGQAFQSRFERERLAQQAHARLEHRLDAWLASLQSPQAGSLPDLRSSFELLRAEAEQADDRPALARLAQAQEQLVQWERVAPALAAAEALVAQAEALAADTSIDDAGLPARWQAVDAGGRTPALAQRFEAALRTVEQRRLAHARAESDAQGTARNRLHAALAGAEQALADGRLHEARAAADEARALKPAAGLLPKPTVQRLARVLQQLSDLERWEKFGQQAARTQLCERAEALAAQTALAPAAIAREVQQLRAEWKALDAQHAGVPRPLWERFDGACEKAYAPAARHFAELAASHKAARKQREEFIAAAAARAAELLAAEPRDWRAIEHWLRDTDGVWHGATLGSVEPAAWKKLDSRLKEALAPLREALAASRRQAKAAREALIAEAEGWVARAQEREAPGAIRDLQARWQANAKSLALLQRDERALWERFRAACNAVFEARARQRQEGDARKHDQRRVFEALCKEAEQLARAGDLDPAQARGRLRELGEQWTRAQAEAGPALAPLQARLRAAREGVEQALKQGAKAERAAQSRALLDRIWLCDDLDALLAGEQPAAELDAALAALQARWAALPPATDAAAQRLAERHDAALAALADEDARWDHRDRIEEAVAARAETLLELELLLDLPSPAELQAERMAVRVKRLRDRFKRAAADGADSAGQLLLAWCAMPGSAGARDRQRLEAIVAALERRR